MKSQRTNAKSAAAQQMEAAARSILDAAGAPYEDPEQLAEWSSREPYSTPEWWACQVVVGFNAARHFLEQGAIDSALGELLAVAKAEQSVPARVLSEQNNRTKWDNAAGLLEHAEQIRSQRGWSYRRVARKMATEELAAANVDNVNGERGEHLLENRSDAIYRQLMREKRRRRQPSKDEG